eukprot:9985801-Alexandrium_andersonii.AAC.1
MVGSRRAASSTCRPCSPKDTSRGPCPIPWCRCRYTNDAMCAALEPEAVARRRPSPSEATPTVPPQGIGWSPHSDLSQNGYGVSVS